MEPITYEDARNFLEDNIYNRDSYIKIDSKTFNPKIMYLLLKVINNCDNFDQIIDLVKILNDIDQEDLEFFEHDVEGIFIYIEKNGIKINSNNTNLNILDWIKLQFNNFNILTNIKVRINYNGENKVLYYFNFPLNKIDGKYVVNGRAFSSIREIFPDTEVQKFYTAFYDKNILSIEQENITKYGTYYTFDNNIFYNILF